MKTISLLFAIFAAVSLIGATEVLPIPTQPGIYSAGAWKYAYAIKSKGARSEKRVGTLTYKDIELKAKPGDILETPFGRLLYFGAGRPVGYSEGWLNTKPYDRPVFKADGKLSDELAQQFKGAGAEVDLAGVLKRSQNK